MEGTTIKRQAIGILADLIYSLTKDYVPKLDGKGIGRAVRYLKKAILVLKKEI